MICSLLLPLFFILILHIDTISGLDECQKFSGEEKGIDMHQVGSYIIFEDDSVRVWNFTLDVGEFTSMHTHPSDYYFVANKPSQLEVYDENCNVLFDFTAAGTMGFKASGDELIPIGVELPWKVPVTHAAKNIGDSVYNEFLFELKGVGQNHPKEL